MASDADLGGYGPWALVTGASSGIGEEFAARLAGAGLNVVLVARRRERLDARAAQLHEEFGVEVRVVALDLSTGQAAAKLDQAVADLDVGLVVHNAGTGWIGRFDLQAPEQHTDQVALHCAFPVDFTARILPRLRSRARSGLLIVSSAGAFIALPYYAVYGATKAFLLSWGEALAEELKGTGVEVLILAPGDTRTEFQDVAGEQSTRWSRVEDVVGEALEGLGRRRLVVPGWENRLMVQALRFLPRRLLVRLAGDRQRQQTPEDRR